MQCNVLWFLIPSQLLFANAHCGFICIFLRLESCPMPVMFDSTSPAREMFESFAPQVWNAVLSVEFIVCVRISSLQRDSTHRACNSVFVRLRWVDNNKHLMTGPEGNSEFFSPRISMFPETKSRETLRFEGNKIHHSPRDQSLSDFLYSKTKQKQILKNSWDSSDNIRPPLITSNSGQHFAGNSELFLVWRHSFCNVARSWHLVGNSFIVRCHVTMN